MDQADTPHPDAELIRQLGGPTQLAERLGFDKAAGGVQRVQNWISRGIPAAVKVQFPELFLARHAAIQKGTQPEGQGVANV